MPTQADEDEDVFAVPSQSKPPTQPAAALPVVDDADEDEDVIVVPERVRLRNEPVISAAPSTLESVKAKARERLSAAKQFVEQHPIQSRIPGYGGLAVLSRLALPTERERSEEAMRQEAEAQQLANISPELTAAAQRAPKQNANFGALFEGGGTPHALPSETSPMQESGVVNAGDSLITKALTKASPEIAEALQTPRSEADKAVLVGVSGGVPVSLHTLKSVYHPFANLYNTLTSPGGLLTAGVGGELGAVAKAGGAAAPAARTLSAAGELSFVKPMAEGTLEATRTFSENPELGTGIELALSTGMTAALARGAFGNIRKLTATTRPKQVAEIARRTGLTPEQIENTAKSEYTRWWEEQMVAEEALRKSQAGAQALKADLAEQQNTAQATYETSPAGEFESLLNRKDTTEAALRSSPQSYEALKADLAEQARAAKEKTSAAFDPKPDEVAKGTREAVAKRAADVAAATREFALKGASLGDLIGKPVEYAGRTGKLIRDSEGNFTVLFEVSKKGEPWMIEVSGTGKDMAASADALGVKPLTPWRQADTAQAIPVASPPTTPPLTGRGRQQFQAAYNLFKKDLAEQAAQPKPVTPTTPRPPLPTEAPRSAFGSGEFRATSEPVPVQPSQAPRSAFGSGEFYSTPKPAPETAVHATTAPAATPPPKGPPPPNPQITPTPPPPPNPPTAKNPGPWRNAYLRIRRNITEDVPEAAKKVVANFSRVHRVDGVYNTPGGQEFLRRTYGALDQFGQQSGRWGNQFNKAVAALGREKSKAANGEYAALYESGAPAPTPAAKPLWDAMETASREEAADMVRNKVEISDPKVEGGKRLFVPMLERHVPRVLSKQVVRALARKKGALYEALAPFQKVEETGAHTALKRELNTDNARSRRVAAIENARGEAFPDTVTLPSGEVVQVYNRNLLEIFPQYIENAARRTAIIEHFGDLREDGTWVNGQGGRAENVVNGLVAQVKETHPIAAKRMADTWADLNGNFSAEREAAMAESGLRTAVAVPDIVARSSMLSGSVLSQPFAAVQVSTREGARNFLRNAVSATTAKTLERAGKRIGLSKLMPETLAKIEEVRDLGGSSTDSLSHTFNTEDLVGAVGSAAKRTLAKTGLNAANVHINDIAGMAALDNLSQSIAALKTPKAAGIYNNLTGKSPAAVRLRLKQNYGFTDADIARMVDSGVARADKARAVQQASKVNLYRESALERAPWMSSQMARTFLPFTSILRQTGYVAKDAAAAAVKTGNLRPLVTLIVGGHIAGAAVGALKDFARGKPDEPPSDDVVDSLRKMAEYQLKAGAFGYGGVPVESLLYAIDSGQIPELEPTVVGWYRTLAEGAVDSWQAGSPKPMAKAVVKATPALTILDRAVEGPVWQERQAKALRRNAKEFKSEQPGSRPEDPTIDKFLKALQGGDTKAARALLPGLRRAKGGSQAIREALDRHEKYYLQGTKEAEEKWLKTLSADQRRAYDAMQQARKETARLGRTLVR